MPIKVCISFLKPPSISPLTGGGKPHPQPLSSRRGETIRRVHCQKR